MTDSSTKTLINDRRQRLDHLLAVNYPEISRSFLQKLCNTDQVLVNDSAQKSGYKLREGDKITILYDMASIDTPPDIELPILYENDAVLVINKPAGVIAHARGKFYNEASVASFVRQHTKGMEGQRAGIVHRLDRATSGIMICAKNETAQEWLQSQFANRTVTKHYQAIIKGAMRLDHAIIDMPIDRNPKAPASFRVSKHGKAAQTTYHVSKQFGDYQLLDLKPLTGRTHQLRVHLAEQGHPIVGDVLYGGEPADRLFLHAYSLAIILPDGQPQTFIAPLPMEFNDFMEQHA